MSNPKPQHGPSPSPSKSSLRRTSGSRNASNQSLTPAPTTHFASEATQHHFLPHSPPNQTLDYEDDHDDDDDEDPNEHAIQESSQQSQSNPHLPFQPFFTLIEDTVTNEHYHPTVHYIFSDDEPDVVTEAACRALAQDDLDPSFSLRTSAPPQDDTTTPDPRLPPTQPGIIEHYLILDIEPSPHTSTSSTTQPPPHDPSQRLSVSASPPPSRAPTQHSQPYTIATHTSLSSTWQISRTTLTDAPTINHTDDDIPSPSGGKHLMLRIEGRGETPPNATDQARAQGESVEDMIERFRSRLGEIRGLMREEEGEMAMASDDETGTETQGQTQLQVPVQRADVSVQETQGLQDRNRMFGKATLDNGPATSVAVSPRGTTRREYGLGLDEQD